MKTETTESVRNLRIALIGLIVVVVALFIIGWIVYKPEPIVIQGSAEVNEVRVSGKLPGRIYKLLAEEGQTVNAGDTLCIIEAMKILNEIESDKTGVVKKICCDNGQGVEYGQALFIIE